MKKLRKFSFVLALFLALSVALTACNNKEIETVENKEETTGEVAAYKSPNGNTMVLTLFQNPKTLDIQKTNADYFIPLQIYNRLVEAKPDGNGGAKIVPSLAESWDISEDGKTYTFHLAKGIKFHNGEEFKADDVLFTIDKMMNPEEGTINSWIFEPIKGAKERLEGKSDSVSGVKVIDDYIIEITLEKEYAPFLATMTDAPASIFNRKAVEEGKDKFGFEPEYTVGTGYLKFKDWKQDQEINLVRNDEYFKEPAHIEGLRYLINVDASTARMMFENGELDLMSIDSKATYDHYMQAEEWRDYVISNDRPGITYMTFNQKCEPMKDVRVRKAIQLAISRDIINKNFFNGTGTIINGCIPPMIPGYNPKLPEIPHDLEKAKKLLAEAGYPNGLDLTLLQNGASKFTHPINETIQLMLSEIGIKLEIKNVDMAAYWEIREDGNNSEYGISVGPMTAGAPDPEAFFSSYKIKDDEVGFYGHKRKEISDAINAANSIVDYEERIKAFQELEKIITQDEALYFPLVSGKGEWVVSPRLKNFHLSWQGWAAGSTHDVEIDPTYNK
ncbi:ABC transporter substrate-binding protein [Tissierella praeacuta]|uniref:ABC transporter substrate-binding protein n=1 Tax=Tissierella praeacuta TaxID=43131 RepID=UPI003DA30D4A